VTASWANYSAGPARPLSREAIREAVEILKNNSLGIVPDRIIVRPYTYFTIQHWEVDPRDCRPLMYASEIEAERQALTDKLVYWVRTVCPARARYYRRTAKLCREAGEFKEVVKAFVRKQRRKLKRKRGVGMSKKKHSPKTADTWKKLMMLKSDAFEWDEQRGMVCVYETQVLITYKKRVSGNVSLIKMDKDVFNALIHWYEKPTRRKES